jgi:transcriptional regulator with XRE-family HTH domain
MSPVTNVIASNIRRLREVKRMSQKEVSVSSGVPQGQYSRIENGLVEPAVSTLEKLAKVFEVSITEFFRSDDVNEPVNIPLLEKIKLIDSLGDEEKQALFKMIDLAISNKRMKDNLQSLIAS